MKQEFWQEKWQANEIGFHQDAPHPLLKKHFSALAPQQAARVFVPLCGKSSDMICLQEQGYGVVGLELSEIAVRAFFSENSLAVNISEAEGYKRFQSGNIEVWCGDFFSVRPELLGDIAAVFDRAALIALPPEMRVQYVEKMRQLMEPGTDMLLIALEYEQGIINPPPFAVVQDEVMTLYSSWCDIELLEKASALVKGKPCHELAYQLKVL